jgi:hypothetical protein
VHAVTRDRKAERAKHDVPTEARLVQKWGPGWMRELWPTHPSLAEETKHEVEAH